MLLYELPSRAKDLNSRAMVFLPASASCRLQALRATTSKSRWACKVFFSPGSRYSRTRTSSLSNTIVYICPVDFYRILSSNLAERKNREKQSK